MSQNPIKQNQSVAFSLKSRHLVISNNILTLSHWVYVEGCPSESQTYSPSSARSFRPIQKNPEVKNGFFTPQGKQ